MTDTSTAPDASSATDVSSATDASSATDVSTAGDRYELVVGLETHVQLLTATKMFCACAADYDGAEPNTRTCPVCLGLPGTLPVPNARAVEHAVRAARALGCAVHPVTWFERKNYLYPDLPKGYQITQYARPIGTDGRLAVEVDGRRVEVGIERLHLEEDTGKLTHVAGGTRIDFNRAGVPLVEIVTRPDLRAPDEAAAYVDALRQLLRWIGASTAVMAAGALRVDVNCSVRRRGDAALGTKVEIKNLNSTAAVRAALAYERRRQVDLLESGQAVVHETRGWVEGAGRTAAQRSKELAHDYRYFPEPDLPPLALAAAWIDAALAAMPELPPARRARLAEAHALRPEAARLVTRDRETADYFEAAAAAYAGPGAVVATWLTGPLFGLLNARGDDLGDAAARIPPGHLAQLIGMVDDRSITPNVAKDVLERMVDGGGDPAAIVAREGLARLGDDGALEAVVAEVVAAHPGAVADYRGGKAAAFGFLMGAVMKATRGQADPDTARRLLASALDHE